LSTDFLWGDRPVPTRGPKPSMTLDRIAGAAVAIADAEGLAAASMQRVSGELGVTKLALYRYLPGRTELVALMVERTLGPPPDLTAGDWRAALARWAGRLLDGYLEHPWLLTATVGARPIGPHELGWMEAALALLTGPPLPAANRQLVSGSSHTWQGFSWNGVGTTKLTRAPPSSWREFQGTCTWTHEVAWREAALAVLAGTPLTATERLDTLAVLAGQARTVAEQQVAARQPEALLTAAIERAVSRYGDRFPALAATMADVPVQAQDQAFRYGLERILDGIAVLIDRRAGQV